MVSVSVPKAVLPWKENKDVMTGFLHQAYQQDKIGVSCVYESKHPPPTHLHRRWLIRGRPMPLACLIPV